MAIQFDSSIYNNVWKPDPMQGVDLQKKYLDIKNAKIQNQLLQQQEQGGELELAGKQNLVEAVRRHTDPKTGQLDAVGFRKDTGFAGNIGQLELIAKTNALNSPVQTGINNQQQPVFEGAQTASTRFNNPGAVSPNALMQPPTQPFTDQNSGQQPANPLAPQDNALRPQASSAPQKSAPTQQQIDDEHMQADYLKNTFDDLAKLPDDELNLSKLYESAADLGAKHIVTNGKLGVPYKMSAVEMSKPDFQQLREGQNGEEPSPATIREWLQNHSAQLAQAKDTLHQHFGPHSSQLQQPEASQPQVAAPEAAAPVQLAGGQQPGGDDTGIMPGGVMAAPPGYAEKQQASRERINSVQSEATAANKTIPVLNEIYNISKGGALTGQASGQVYSYLSSHGLAVPGITEPVQQLQEISKYMEQAMIAAGLPNSDAKLESLRNANTHPEQLPGTIQALIPFLKAQMQGAVEKQKFYNSTLKGDLSPDKEVAAKAQWDNNYDPRWLMFDDLPVKGKDRGEFLSEHPDMLDKIDQYENLTQMGVAKNHHKKK